MVITQKIPAIKCLRDAVGLLGLKDAKELIEGIRNTDDAFSIPGAEDEYRSLEADEKKAVEAVCRLVNHYEMELAKANGKLTNIEDLKNIIDELSKQQDETKLLIKMLFGAIDCHDWVLPDFIADMCRYIKDKLGL